MSVNDHRNSILPEDVCFLIKDGDTKSNSTYIFGNEDHTLGNVIRFTLMQRPETEFCGYSVPHPYEPKLNVRLQTQEGKSALKTLKSGLQDLEHISDVLENALDEALIEFETSEK